MAKKSTKVLDVPLVDEDVKFAQRYINDLFAGVTTKVLTVEGIPIEKFSREYLIKLLYIYCVDVMEVS